MCFADPTPPTLAGASTEEEYVLALAGATQRGEVSWRQVDGEWLARVLRTEYTESSTTVTRENGRGLLRTFDAGGRVFRTIRADKSRPGLLLALTRLLVAIRRAQAPAAEESGKRCRT